jgi:hypothetical protein
MGTTRASGEINRPRRQFFGAAAVTVAAAQLGLVGSASAQPGETKATQPPAAKSGVYTSFRPRQWASGHPSARLALRHLQLC